jgi:hypothetical protein
VYGVAEPAQALRCHSSLQLPAEHALVIHAAGMNGVDRRELRRVRAEAGGVTVYEYSENGLAHFFIFRDGEVRKWNFADWESDAGFFYYCSEAQRTSRLAACNLTVIRYRGEQLVSAGRPVERFEYWECDGKRQASSSEPEVVRVFSDGALASLEPGVIR